MERPMKFIVDMTDKKDLWKIAVKVKDIWTIVKDGKEHLELIIVDAKVFFLFPSLVVTSNIPVHPHGYWLIVDDFVQFELDNMYL
jgi:hypothetical protein